MPLFYRPPTRSNGSQHVCTSDSDVVKIEESFNEPTNARECLFWHRLPVFREVKSKHVPQPACEATTDARPAIRKLLAEKGLDHIVFKRDTDLIETLCANLEEHLCDPSSEPSASFMAKWMTQVTAQEETHDVCEYPSEADQRSAYRCSLLTLAELFISEDNNLSPLGVSVRDSDRPVFSLAPDNKPCGGAFACYCKSVDVGAVRFLIDVESRTANDSLSEIWRQWGRRAALIVRITDNNIESDGLSQNVQSLLVRVFGDLHANKTRRVLLTTWDNAFLFQLEASNVVHVSVILRRHPIKLLPVSSMSRDMVRRPTMLSAVVALALCPPAHIEDLFLGDVSSTQETPRKVDIEHCSSPPEIGGTVAFELGSAKVFLTRSSLTLDLSVLCFKAVFASQYSSLSVVATGRRSPSTQEGEVVFELTRALSYGRLWDVFERKLHGFKVDEHISPMSGGSSASPPDAFDQLPSSAHSVEQDSAKGHCSGNPTSETLSSFDPSFGRKYTMASSSASLPALAGIPVVLKLSALLPADPDKDCDPKKLDYDEVPRDVTEHALNEARLYQGGLKDLQGTVVPRCYGAFTADLESGGSVFGLIPEHLGEPPPQEFLTGLHNLHKKEMLRLYSAIHERQIAQGDVEVRHLRSAYPFDPVPYGKEYELRLIDFDGAQVGSEEEVAGEYNFVRVNAIS